MFRTQPQKYQAILFANRIVEKIKDAGVSYGKRYSYHSKKKGTWKVKLWHCSKDVKQKLEDAGVFKYLDRKGVKYKVLDGSHVMGFCPTGFAFWIDL